MVYYPQNYGYTPNQTYMTVNPGNYIPNQPNMSVYSGEYQNMQQQTNQSNNNPEPSTNIIWVQGQAGAKAYPVPNGNTLALFDTEDDFLYFKSVDKSGVPLPLTIIKLNKVDDIDNVSDDKSSEDNVMLDGYVTKEKYDELEKRVYELENNKPTKYNNNNNNKKG